MTQKKLSCMHPFIPFFFLTTKTCMGKLGSRSNKFIIRLKFIGVGFKHCTECGQRARLKLNYNNMKNFFTSYPDFPCCTVCCFYCSNICAKATTKKNSTVSCTNMPEEYLIKEWPQLWLYKSTRYHQSSTRKINKQWKGLYQFILPLYGVRAYIYANDPKIIICLGTTWNLIYFY